MNTNSKGRIAELIAEAKYISLGYTVLEPVNKDGVYDFVIEKDNKFQKVQVKTLTDKIDYYVLKAINTTQNIKETKTRYYSKEEIDILVGVDIINKDVFQVYFKDCSKSGIVLRKNNPKSNQKTNIKFASDYKI